MASKYKINLDGGDFLEVSHDEFVNEIHTLKVLYSGLLDIYESVRQSELGQLSGSRESFGSDNKEQAGILSLVMCKFHWFGLSLCNYVRLVGFIRGIHRNEFCRGDVSNRQGKAKIKDSIRIYVASVQQIEKVKIWRDKVFAHFAITDPSNDDNVATLDMSVIPIVKSGPERFRVGSFVMAKGNGQIECRSDLPEWSLTEVFESLATRYWPIDKLISGERQIINIH